jgi:enoyl-CoA hydratase/carnithine racemase
MAPQGGETGPIQEPAHAGVRLRVDGPLATVTLADPATRNAQTPRTWQALASIGSALPGSVRVVLLRAEGPSFSAGLDRGLLPTAESAQPSAADLLGRRAAEDIEATLAEYQRAFTWWRRNDLVSVAVVQGHAIGAGCQLALACDLRLLAEDAQLALPEASLGLVPDLGGTKALVDLVGYARALEICLTGRRVGAQEALRLGLATSVWPRAELDSAATELVEALLATPRSAAAETKALLRGAAERDAQSQRAAERAASARLLREWAGLGE